MNEDAIFERYILKLKINGLKNCGMHGNLLLHELFVRYGERRGDGTNGEIVQGYISVGKESCWHVWVESEKKYDVVRRLTGSSFEYLREKPEAGAEEDPEVSAQYELYTKDKSEFWKKSAPKMKNFRAKMMQKLF